MKRRITCIICPRGCTMTAQVEGDRITVTGNACPRGEKHAVVECTNPVRTLTTTVRVANREDTMVSVKSAAPIAKEKIMEAMERIRSATAAAPIAIGDVIVPDVFGTEIVATREIL